MFSRTPSPPAFAATHILTSHGVFSKLADALSSAPETTSTTVSCETVAGDSLRLGDHGAAGAAVREHDCWKAGGGGGSSQDKVACGKVLLLEASPWLPESAAWAYEHSGSSSLKSSALTFSSPEKGVVFAASQLAEHVAAPESGRLPTFGVAVSCDDASLVVSRKPLGPIGPTKQNQAGGIGGASMLRDLCDPLHVSALPEVACLSADCLVTPDSAALVVAVPCAAPVTWRSTRARSTLETIAEEAAPVAGAPTSMIRKISAWLPPPPPNSHHFFPRAAQTCLTWLPFRAFRTASTPLQLEPLLRYHTPLPSLQVRSGTLPA